MTQRFLKIICTEIQLELIQQSLDKINKFKTELFLVHWKE